VNLKLAREGKGGFLDEHKIITRTGQQKIVEVTGRKINFGGKSADIIGLRDITQRRRAEEAFRESEDLFRNLVSNMLDCLLIVDSDGNILFASEAILELAEIQSVNDIVGGKISLFLSNEDFEKALRYLRGGNINFLFNYRIRTARSNTKYIEGIGNKIKFRGHDALIMNLRDVTGRKRAEQALLEAYGKLQTEMEERAQAEQELSKYRTHLEEMVEERTAQLKRANLKLEREIAERKKSEQKIKDLNMLLLSAKMITESLLRARTEEELVRSTCNHLAELDFIRFVWAGFTEPADFSVKPLAWAGFENGYLSQVKITWDDSEYSRGPTGTAIRTGKISIVDDVEQDPNFSPWREQALKRGYRSVFAIPVSYREEVMGYLTVYSGRKGTFGNAETEFLTQIAEDVAVGVKSLRLEKELESKHVELQKAYAELKASEEMVVQQEKLASIGQLAAGIAHEIKNPLAIILQGTEFMKSCVEEDEFLSDSAERIKNSANRADNIIKGLLSFSRQGSLNLDLGDLSDVLNESVSLVNHQLTLKSIKVLKQIEDVPPIRFDSNQMKQVFINLLMNSIESMDSGGPINIELRRAPESSNEILLKISDKGYGIDKETLKKIFDPFFTTKRKRGGTGLGLSITKGIIEKHKGRISVESDIGVGTAVSIYLPYDNEQGA
ncbi:MAG: ATP-binding protein, partial [Syntrophaceae bacterium]